MSNNGTPDCLSRHLDHDKVVREHDCHMPKPVSILVDCAMCKRHRAPRSKGICWWCEQVMNDSNFRKPEGVK